MKKGKNILSAVLCLALFCVLAGPAGAVETPEITWLPEGVVPVNTTYWNIDSWYGGEYRHRDVEVKKGDLIAVKRDGKYGYIDLSGELVVPLTDISNDSAVRAFFYSDGLLAVWQYDGEEKFTGTNYVDKTGKTIIELDGKLGYAFSDGAALVKERDSWGEWKYGVINAKGKIVVPCEYDDVCERTYGLKGGFAKLKKRNAEGKNDEFFVSADGKTIIPLGDYDETSYFSEGRAAVYKDGKWGYIDEKGVLVIPCEYEKAGDFDKDGYATVLGIIEGEDAYFPIDKNGKQRLEGRPADPERAERKKIVEKLESEGYDVKLVCDNGSALVWNQENRKHGYVNAKGELVLPIEYDYLWREKGLLFAVKDGKSGYINDKGETVVPFFEYEWPKTIGDEYYLGEFRIGYGRGVGLIMDGYIGVVYKDGRYGLFENPYYEEPKSAGVLNSLFSGGKTADSAKPSTPSVSGGEASAPSSGGVPLLPVAGAVVAAALGGFVLLRKKRR